jgi:hypothetical protein
MLGCCDGQQGCLLQLMDTLCTTWIPLECCDAWLSVWTGGPVGRVPASGGNDGASWSQLVCASVGSVMQGCGRQRVCGWGDNEAWCVGGGWLGIRVSQRLKVSPCCWGRSGRWGVRPSRAGCKVLCRGCSGRWGMHPSVTEIEAVAELLGTQWPLGRAS